MSGSRSVLAVYASARGIGFVLFESPLSIIDWGVKSFAGETKNSRCARAVEKLLASYSPDCLVIEDARSALPPRSNRVCSLYQLLAGLAGARGIDVDSITSARLTETFRKLGARTKHERAMLVASYLSALAPRVPPPRKVWQSENPNMAMFQAAMLGFVMYTQIEEEA